MSYGGHVVDASRVPYLEVWDESAGAFVPGTGLTVEYASAAECGDPGSSDGWSDTPTASPGAVRVRVEDLSLAVANTVAARIALPYVVQPTSQFSRHPEPTPVKDVVSGVWNPHPGASWSNGLPAGYTVQGISLDVTQTTQMRATFDLQRDAAGCAVGGTLVVTSGQTTATAEYGPACGQVTLR